MLDQLKRMAMQQLMNKMTGNRLGSSETEQAAQSGANGLMETISSALGAGKMDQVKDLLSNNDNPSEGNELFQNIKAKLQNSLQEQGMSAEEAAAEAENTAPDLINGLKEKFESQDEADKGFDLGSLTQLAGGNLGDVLKNPGSVLDAAKGLLGK